MFATDQRFGSAVFFRGGGRGGRYCTSPIVLHFPIAVLEFYFSMTQPSPQLPFAMWSPVGEAFFGLGGLVIVYYFLRELWRNKGRKTYFGYPVFGIVPELTPANTTELMHR